MISKTKFNVAWNNAWEARGEECSMKRIDSVLGTKNSERDYLFAIEKREKLWKYAYESMTDKSWDTGNLIKIPKKKSCKV